MFYYLQYPNKIFYTLHLQILYTFQKTNPTCENQDIAGDSQKHHHQQIYSKNTKRTKLKQMMFHSKKNV
jgi:hypothetical protein